jgi:hypothetical protein
VSSLPRIDEHSTELAACPNATWQALVTGVPGATAVHACVRRPGRVPRRPGSVCRALVIGTRGQVLVTRRMLNSVGRRAEREKIKR